MKNIVKITFVVLIISMVLMACGTTVRSITHTRWEKDYSYFTYWEGVCRPILGCNKGKSVITRCNYNDDNTATCVEESAAVEILNPHLK